MGSDKSFQTQRQFLEKMATRIPEGTELTLPGSKDWKYKRKGNTISIYEGSIEKPKYEYVSGSWKVNTPDKLATS